MLDKRFKVHYNRPTSIPETWREREEGMERSAFVASGVPQLDLILGGGIVKNSVLLIIGPSGSGKTVLAAQIAFAAAERGASVLFITAFAEPHNKLITNLQTLRFFNGEHIGERIRLLNLQHQLTTSTEEAADTIVREARAADVDLAVIDGFQGVRVTSQSPVAPNQFLYDLSSKMSLLGVTTIVTYDLPSATDAAAGELSAGDGIIELTQELHGEQAMRLLRVVKHRGADPLLGRHSFTLTDTGLTCYPLQESVTVAANVALGDSRAAFGIANLDAMLRGGLTTGTATIAAGAYGVGKTLLGLHFVMAGADRNERALFLTFHETPLQLIAKGALFGMDVQAAVDSGLLTLRHYLAADLNADQIAQQLRDILVSEQIERVVIDGLNEIERPLIERGRAHGYFAALIATLRNHGVTTYITQEIDPVIGREMSFAAKNMTALADNILLLRHGEGPGEEGHSITVLKMRFSDHERQPHKITIGEHGMTVAAPAVAVQSGRSHRAKRTRP
jgi:circadian clock protein KaiC